MNSDQPNPYSPPQTSGPDMVVPGGPQLSPDGVARAEAIVKDAGQFWLAIVMCILCTSIGSIIIGPWYLVRLMQWNSLAKEFPVLLRTDVPHGSLAQRFQASRTKLIIGICFGGIMLVVGVVGFAAISVLG